MNKLYLIAFLIHLIVITNLRAAQIGHVNLYKVFKSHHDYSRYNFFLNRFVSISDKKKIEKDVKLARQLQVQLLIELDQLIQKKQQLNRMITKQYDQLRSTRNSLISFKLISMAKKIKKSDREHFLRLINLKIKYQQKLNAELKSSFMDYVDSQSFWKDVVDEILIAIEKVRVKNQLSIIIQNNYQKEDREYFFSELDNQISNNSRKLFRDIMQNPKLFSAGFSSIAKQVSMAQHLKIIPNPNDITQDVINEL